MEQIIENIIRQKIKRGHFFDAHSIIDYLIQHESDTYLASHQNGWTTAYYHSEISKMIDQFQNNGLIVVVGKSWSRNIHQNFSENHCWQKL